MMVETPRVVMEALGAKRLLIVIVPAVPLPTVACVRFALVMFAELADNERELRLEMVPVGELNTVAPRFAMLPFCTARLVELRYPKLPVVAAINGVVIVPKDDDPADKVDELKLVMVPVGALIVLAPSAVTVALGTIKLVTTNVPTVPFWMVAFCMKPLVIVAVPAFTV